MATTGPRAAHPVPLHPVPPRRRRRFVRALVLLLIATIGLFALYLFAALAWSYSEGERAGYMQKLSRKGFVCKTWEGELALVNLPGAMPEIFRFTVRDDAVAARVNEALGQRVSLHYEQHLGLPTTCLGETSFFVTDVRPIVEP